MCSGSQPTTPCLQACFIQSHGQEAKWFEITLSSEHRLDWPRVGVSWRPQHPCHYLLHAPKQGKAHSRNAFLQDSRLHARSTVSLSVFCTGQVHLHFFRRKCPLTAKNRSGTHHTSLRPRTLDMTIAMIIPSIPLLDAGSAWPSSILLSLCPRAVKRLAAPYIFFFISRCHPVHILEHDNFCAHSQ